MGEDQSALAWTRCTESCLFGCWDPFLLLTFTHLSINFSSSPSNGGTSTQSVCHRPHAPQLEARCHTQPVPFLSNVRHPQDPESQRTLSITAGIRGIREEGKNWTVSHPACPTGFVELDSRYNDAPCNGNGKCVEGRRVCDEMWSGLSCDVQGWMTPEIVESIGRTSTYVVVAVLSLSLITHALMFTVGTVIYTTRITVAGDFWSLVYHIQFCALLGQYDSQMPPSFARLSEHFRYFTLQLDPQIYLRLRSWPLNPKPRSTSGYDPGP